ncbi:MAG: Na-translocating system protein MpsB, partial [Halobacteriovoraceae bacterium]|nr:Na-translocating system protein MpsB [Halobacteriovoraceae bacterium]
MRKTEEADFSVSHDENEYRNALEWCEKYLLRQGPLEYFVHHNTLHAFESEEFFKGLFKAKDLFGARTLMPISWFQEEYKKGRISMDDLSSALDKHSPKSFELTPLLEWNELYPKVENPIRDKFINEF